MCVGMYTSFRFPSLGFIVGFQVSVSKSRVQGFQSLWVFSIFSFIWPGMIIMPDEMHALQFCFIALNIPTWYWY